MKLLYGIIVWNYQSDFLDIILVIPIENSLLIEPGVAEILFFAFKYISD